MTERSWLRRAVEIVIRVAAVGWVVLITVHVIGAGASTTDVTRAVEAPRVPPAMGE